MVDNNGARVLLTGATGMIGANLTRHLIDEGFHVYVMVRPNSNTVRLDPVLSSVEVLHAHIADRVAVHEAVDASRPEIVFHLASTALNPPTTDPETHMQVNVIGTLHLLEALKDFPESVVVFTGSSAASGGGAQVNESRPQEPGTLYGASKACASVLMQTYLRLHHMHTVELRLWTPYGPWEHPRRLIPHVILSAMSGHDVLLTRGDQQRDFVYMDDVVDALMQAATQPLSEGSVFNIGSGVGTPVREVVELTLNLMGNPVKPLLGALSTRPDEIMEMSADISAARNNLGWQPKTSLEEGLTKSIAWFTEHREIALTFP